MASTDTNISSLRLGTMTNALLPEQFASALGGTPDTRMANIQAGGQLGVGGRVLSLDGATPAVLNCCHIVVLQTPTMWDVTEEGKIMAKTVKALFEVHAKEVSGIDFGYTLNTSESLIGHDSQQASMPTTTARSAVSPSFTWTEAYGNVVWNTMYKWLLDIQHPDTQVSHLSSTLNEEVPAWVYSAFSLSFIAIQPDPTGIPGRIYDAAVYSNVFPTETGMIGFKRTPGTADVPDRTINFKAIVSHNDNTRELGKVVMSILQMHRPNYQRALTYDPNILHEKLYGHEGIYQTSQEALLNYTDNGYSMENGYSDAGYQGTAESNGVADANTIASYNA